MKFLIQQNNTLNVAPIVNTITTSLQGQCEVGFFADDIDVTRVVHQLRPDIIMYYDNLASRIQPLLTQTRCLKVEHATDTGTKSADYEFSLTNPHHENFVQAPCNTFILDNTQPAVKFLADISFLGPPNPKAVSYMDDFLRIDSPHVMKIYGQNRYYNWRYCGVIDDSDISSVYASSTCVPVFNRGPAYDARVLDALFCYCVPVIEYNDKLIEMFGEDIKQLMFTDKVEFQYVIEDVIAHPDKYKAELLPRLRNQIISKHTWYDVCANLFKSLGLKQVANTISLAKRMNVR